MGGISMQLNGCVTKRLAVLTLVVTVSVCSCREEVPESVAAVARPPAIRPDYAGVVLPPNIGPLNFIIDESGQRFRATIHSAVGDPIAVTSTSGEIVIPPSRWKDLLTRNAGKELYVDVCVKTEDGTWNQYERIVNTIAAETIDSHLVYRYMTPSSYFPKPMQIVQRNLESSEDETVLDTESFDKGCAHCHSFIGNDPDKMLLGTRSTSFPSATLYAHDRKVEKIGAKFGYTAWHPSGKMVTYSVNDVRQFFHSAQPEIHDVIDFDSAIFYYDVEGAKVKMTPAIADKKRLETYPAWTPDGKYLYFCSAPMLWTETPDVLPERYRDIKYDLMRISYDVTTDRWGTLETVLSAAQTGRSILLPRVSPDGRFLLFCMTDYGCFPIYQPSSDLYLMNLKTGMYDKARVNSEHAEGWHSFSSNGRWITFSSKRQDGVHTRPFLAHVDANGQMGKPFVLPQPSPSFYDACFYVYSLPELIAGPVTVDSEALTRAILSPTQIAVNSLTGATPKTDSTKAYTPGQTSVQ